MTTVALRVFRALAVPGIVLVPKGLAEWTYHGAGGATFLQAARLVHRFPLIDDVVGGGKVVFAHILDFLAKTVEGECKAFRNVAWVVMACGGIGEDGFHTVVAGHDDKAFTAFDVENVVVDGIAVESR